MKNAEDILSNPAPDILYHYTNIKGLLGIVNSSSIWATSLLYLNDTLEYSYAFEMMLQEAKIYKEIYDNIFRYRRSDIFVCSFSKEKDLLSQWRAYASNTGGFSIGFRSSALQLLAKNQKFSLLPCIYDPDIQRELIKKKLIKYDRMFKENPSGFNFEEITKDFCKIFPMIKHPKFCEEKEWRLISEVNAANNCSKFREGNYSIIPYVEFSLKDDQCGVYAIDEIMIGAGLDYDLNERALFDLFSAKHYSGNILIPGRGILKSKVPYRS